MPIFILIELSLVATGFSFEHLLDFGFLLVNEIYQVFEARNAKSATATLRVFRLVDNLIHLLLGGIATILQAHPAEKHQKREETSNATDEEQPPEALQRKPAIIHFALLRATFFGQPFVMDSLEVTVF